MHILQKDQTIICCLWIIACSLVNSLFADEVRLVEGDVLHGKVLRQDDEVMVLNHPVLGELVINKSDIERMVVEDEPIEEDKGTETEALAEEPQSIFAKFQEKGWAFSMDFSLDGSYGNTDEQSMRVGANAKREIPNSLLMMDASFYHKIKNGSISDNKSTFGSTHEWRKPESQGYLFATGRFDYDEFKSWRQRFNFQSGPGYYLILNDFMTWKAGAGLGLRKEWGSFNDNLKFEGAAITSFSWKVTQRQSFECDFAYSPVIDNTEDFRTRTSFNWRFALSRTSNIDLLLGGLYEYQSVVDPGSGKNDLRLYTGLQFSF